MTFFDAIDAIKHAAYRAMMSGKPWGVYFSGQFIAAPLGRLDAEDLIEACHP